MKKACALLCLFVCFLFIKNVRAERDVFGLGVGRNGALTISSATTINTYAPVEGILAPSDVTLVMGTPKGSADGFGPGDLIMVWQATGLVPNPPSGDTGPFNMSSSSSGHWEFARIAMVSSSTVTLTAPLIRSYNSNTTQIIRVPEYTAVTINAGGTIAASPWDGRCGGIIAFLATGTVTNNGNISAAGMGFRAGQYVNDMSGAIGVTGFDAAAPGGAQKGEGLAFNRYGSSHTGYGNVANAGGGGLASKSGGGGGGNGGAGGRGGRSDGYSDGARLVGGLGGGALSNFVQSQLFMGGGGGAGHSNDATGIAGGRGGGVVFVRCNQLSGTGTITANGGSAAGTTLDGGSGGGAGGTIYLRSVTTASFTNMTARGGNGSSINDAQVGPGGGGGGGIILLQRSSGTGSPSVLGAAAGSQIDPTTPYGMSFGATAGSNGVVTILTSGMALPASPVIIAPADGSLVAGTPTISGTASANAQVEIYLDNNLLATVTSDASGNFSYTVPFLLADGSHTLMAYTVVQDIYSSSATYRNFNSSATLPLRLIRFGADKKALDVDLQWTTTDESRIIGFTIERSLDGHFFEPIGQVGATNTGGQHHYRFLDRQPGSGLRYYRLKITEEKDQFQFSQVLTVQLGTGKGIAAYPNPATETLHLQLPAGRQDVQLVDASGKTVYRKQVTVAENSVRITVDIRALAPGVYYVLAGGQKTTFVKTAAP